MASSPSQPSSASSQPKSWTAERALRDVAWVAKFLGVSKSWVYQASASGVLPVIRIGALVRFDKRAVEAWIQKESSKPR